MSYVYTGHYLRLDLTTGEQRLETITEADARKYYLGSGYAAKLFYEEMDPALDPLDPRAPLYVFVGLLTGTFVPTSCRLTFAGRSPLTGIWNESNVGGHIGPELRAAGLEGLVITGQADHPVYLYAHDGTVEVRDATHLWGWETFAAYERLLAETDPKARAAVIGPAGEHQVKYASIMQGGHEHSRAAGRGGLGAVMGSKRLKAIVARGTSRPTYADLKGLQAVVKEYNAYLKEASIGMAAYGTAGGVIAADAKGDMPTRNWAGGGWAEGARKISGQTIHETIWVKHTFCFACPIGCGKLVEVKEGPYAGVYGEGPEYETLAGFGALLEVDNLEAIARSNDLCNRLGLDTISASAVVAFATEAMERGQLTPADLDGISLAWGEPEGGHRLLEQIAYRRGAGDWLAEGVRAAAAQLGHGAAAFAVHVKGLEVAYHDPRAFVSMAANYATANRGACHLEALSYWRGYGVEHKGWHEGPHDRFQTEGAARLAADYQNYLGTYNPLGLCKFIGKAGITPAQIARLIAPAFGWEITADEVLQTGERLFNLKRLINLRLGITRADDTLPPRLLNEPRPTGGAAGNLPDLEALLAEYYAYRNWLPDGHPAPEKLAELGL